MCVFTELGWLDSDFVSDDALIQADIETLPTEIAEALSGDEYDQCVEKVEQEIMDYKPEYENTLEINLYLRILFLGVMQLIQRKKWLN